MPPKHRGEFWLGDGKVEVAVSLRLDDFRRREETGIDWSNRLRLNDLSCGHGEIESVWNEQEHNQERRLRGEAREKQSRSEEGAEIVS